MLTVNCSRPHQTSISSPVVHPRYRFLSSRQDAAWYPVLVIDWVQIWDIWMSHCRSGGIKSGISRHRKSTISRALCAECIYKVVRQHNLGAWCGKFNSVFLYRSFIVTTVKESLKSVHVWQSYARNKQFFWLTVYSLLGLRYDMMFKNRQNIKSRRIIIKHI